eukprot:185525-Amphidinium_carterae.1
MPRAAHQAIVKAEVAYDLRGRKQSEHAILLKMIDQHLAPHFPTGRHWGVVLVQVLARGSGTALLMRWVIDPDAVSRWYGWRTFFYMTVHAIIAHQEEHRGIRGWVKPCVAG